MSNDYNRGYNDALKESQESKARKRVFRKKFWGFFFWYLWMVTASAAWLSYVGWLLTTENWIIGVVSIAVMVVIIGLSIAAEKATKVQHEHDEKVRKRNERQ